MVRKVIQGLADFSVKSDARKIISFYLDCLEEEDLKGLSFNTKQLNQSFVLGIDGSFLLKEKQVQISYDRDSYFWKSRETKSDESERLYLGYPILVQDRIASPLFFIEVEAKASSENIISLTVTDNFCFLNHHLFAKVANGLEESRNLQEELECDLSALHESLETASEYLGVHLDKAAILDDQKLRMLNGTGAQWVDNFMLFRGGRSAVNAMLRRDLETFLKYPKFIENIDKTALGLFFKTELSDRPIDNIKPKFSSLNDAQQSATDIGLSQRLTVVTGPPGTGKSQVVTNILANCALTKKSVLFASKNNKAVDVVYEKLSNMLLNENWILRLGNNEKVTECQERVLTRLGESHEPLPQLEELEVNLAKVEKNIADISQLIVQLEKQQVRLNDADKKVRQLEGELDSRWIGYWSEKPVWGEYDERVKAQLECQLPRLYELSGQSKSRLWVRLLSFIFSTHFKKYYKKHFEKLLQSYPDDLKKELSFLLQDGNSFSSLVDAYKSLSDLLNLKYFYYEKMNAQEALLSMPTALQLKSQKAAETEQQIQLYQQKLKTSWGTAIGDERQKLFGVVRRYFATIQNPPQDAGGWKKWSTDFTYLVNHFYIWIVTNLSARKSISLEAGAFDLVIIDEASQCDILSALPLLYRAKSAIIIGDPKQLKHISLVSHKREKELAAKHGIEDVLHLWSYRNKSIYDVAESKLIDSSKEPVLLNTHYRCHPEIIGFSNDALYESKLSTQTDISHLQKKFQDTQLGVFWHDVKGSVPPLTSGAFNQEEVNYIISLIDKWKPTIESSSLTLGIVTPFRKQVEKLRTAIEMQKGRWSESFCSSITVGTAHTFQGDECDLIIFSPVVAKGIKPNLADWVANTNELLNVAVTRARGAFHVVGDRESCRDAGYLLEELVTYIHDCRHGKLAKNLYESPAEEIVGEILSSLNISFFAQVAKGSYRLDFVVSTPFGNKINLEIDGRQHYTSEHVERDETRDRYVSGLGYKVIRIDAKDVYTRREVLKRRLAQLV